MSRYGKQHLFGPDTVHHAAEAGDLAALERLVQDGLARGYPAMVTLQARDEILECMPVHAAAEKGQDEVIKYLIKQHVDLDAGDGHMVTPLHLSAVTNQLSTTKLLLDSGANLTRQDNEGDQPLHWAATRGHTQILELLLDRGAQIDAPNRQGWTALHRAACNGCDAACRLLLRRGASIHALTADHSTPLHMAAKFHQLGVLHLLLDLGSRTDFVNIEGLTPADLCGGDAARELLEEKAAADAAAGRSRVPSGRSGPTGAVAAAAATQRQAGAVLHAPEMPRYRPKANANLDADGFPVSLPQPAAWEQQAQAEEGEEQQLDTQLLVVEGSLASSLGAGRGGGIGSVRASHESMMTPWNAEEEGTHAAAAAAAEAARVGASSSSGGGARAFAEGAARAPGGAAAAEGGAAGSLASSASASSLRRSLGGGGPGELAGPAGQAGYQRSSGGGGGLHKGLGQSFSSSGRRPPGSEQPAAGGRGGLGRKTADDVLAPAAKAPGLNKRFLSRYGLGKMGLFAP